MAPPARSGLLLRAELRLRDKLAQAERTIGRGLDVLPTLSADAVLVSAADPAPAGRGTASFLAVAEQRGEIHRLLARWRRSAQEDLHVDEPIIAAAASSARGWIAALDDGRLITSLRNDRRPMDHEDDPTDDIAALFDALRHADGASRPANDIESIAARRRVEQWIAHDWALRSCSVAPHASPMRQRVLHQVEHALRVVPRHRRRAALSLASSLRTALDGRLTLGLERALLYPKCDPPNDIVEPLGAGIRPDREALRPDVLAGLCPTNWALVRNPPSSMRTLPSTA